MNVFLSKKRVVRTRLYIYVFIMIIYLPFHVKAKGITYCFDNLSLL